MSHVEFVHWKAKYRRHPFGQVHEDYRFGVLVTLLNGVIQSNSWSKKKLNLPRMEKYFPALKEILEAAVAQSPEEMANVLRALCMAHGGKIIKADGTVIDYSGRNQRPYPTRPPKASKVQPQDV